MLCFETLCTSWVDLSWNFLSWSMFIRWGDGTSRNDVSPYDCSCTFGPQINRPLWHNVPRLIFPCHYALYNTFRLVQNDREVSMQGHCVSGTIHLGDQGSQNIRSGTHRFRTSRHPTFEGYYNGIVLIDIHFHFNWRRWLYEQSPIKVWVRNCSPVSQDFWRKT
jgi:hypothetical protein